MQILGKDRAAGLMCYVALRNGVAAVQQLFQIDQHLTLTKLFRRVDADLAVAGNGLIGQPKASVAHDLERNSAITRRIASGPVPSANWPRIT